MKRSFSDPQLDDDPETGPNLTNSDDWSQQSCLQRDAGMRPWTRSRTKSQLSQPLSHHSEPSICANRSSGLCPEDEQGSQVTIHSDYMEDSADFLYRSPSMSFMYSQVESSQRGNKTPMRIPRTSKRCRQVLLHFTCSQQSYIIYYCIRIRGSLISVLKVIHYHACNLVKKVSRELMFSIFVDFRVLTPCATCRRY